MDDGPDENNNEGPPTHLSIKHATKTRILTLLVDRPINTVCIVFYFIF